MTHSEPVHSGRARDEPPGPVAENGVHASVDASFELSLVGASRVLAGCPHAPSNAALTTANFT